ncbi:hybrid sensor histidine kinase/response regulator [Aliivibrio finisterrensis]|nr:ATP-binding protein [Aliivibrio finisterrensis]RYU68515.1 hybrid sensor histidine kinase/response regulator [Aliivibrio finisterrensis]RYU72173.1 hybrid sensor histidine kinase/response regulator [Aliivibrio finisterrensis]RYU75689.1 hybrid sensor histidine kinase/response regulator [Aliivibrio finisterrensis]
MSNAAILVLFVVLLTYSAFQIVQVTSKNQFYAIKESITDYNKQLLLTFVKAQNLSLNKEVELITEEVRHMSLDFAHDIVNLTKTNSLRNKQLIYINKNLKPVIQNVSFIDMVNHIETRIVKDNLTSFKNNVNVNKLFRYQNFYIGKEINGDNIEKFSMYIETEHWPNALLKVDLNLDYFEKSLTFENMIDELQYRYFLVDDKGKLIASNLKQDVYTLMNYSSSNGGSQSVENYIMSNNRGVFSVTADNEVYNITFLKNKKTGWRLNLVTPESVVRSSYATTKELLLSADSLLFEKLSISTVVLLLLFLVINSFAINRLISPISKLMDQARSLKEKDFIKATSLVHNKGDEIEQLSKAYCEAGEQIKVLVEGLEHKVEERTKLYEVATKEAREANDQKSILLSNVSHEIRTPLNAIIGYTHILNKTNTVEMDKHYLSGISTASHTILGIVNDLLDLERIQASNYTLHPKMVVLNKLLHDIEMTFLPLASNKQLSLTINTVDIEDSSKLYIDELRFKQALSNIVFNAIKFTGEGQIDLTVSPEIYEGNNQLTFSIKDTGVGIPQHKLRSIFNDFEQVNEEDKQFGFGLGLAITRTIVNLMGGQITVTSEVGKGTEFKVRLPTEYLYLNYAEVDSGVVRGDCILTEPSYTKKRALIVDDVEFNREILQYHLEQYGFECVQASDGEEALNITENQPFDIVLTDISMPKMDGVEFAKRLKNRQHDLPIIAVTARATVKEESRMSHYFDFYLTKPIDENDLSNALKRALLDS